jgi:formylglycine-generating enzyme required for sulfatase activity
MRQTSVSLLLLVAATALCVVAVVAVARLEVAEDAASAADGAVAGHLAALTSADPAVRRAGADALVAIGPRALFRLCPFIRRHLGDPHEHAWRAAYDVEERIADRYAADEELDAWYRGLPKVELPTMVARLPGGLRMQLVRIPAGTFIQGSGNPGTGVLLAPDMPCAYAPVRKVTISRPFWIARDVVTQAQWEALMGFNRCRVPCPDDPVDTISWYEAVEFCRRLSKRNPPHRFTLPTEAQWEYACRAGGTSRHAFGNEPLIRGDWRLEPGGPWHENRFGLRHIHSRVFEWCRDWFAVWTPGAVTDPAGPDGGAYKAIRSNYQFCSAAECRAAHRSGFPPDVRRNGIGLRVACPVPQG